MLVKALTIALLMILILPQTIVTIKTAECFVSTYIRV